jgi:hypothetical protein
MVVNDFISWRRRLARVRPFTVVDGGQIDDHAAVLRGTQRRAGWTRHPAETATHRARTAVLRRLELSGDRRDSGVYGRRGPQLRVSRVVHASHRHGVRRRSPQK